MNLSADSACCYLPERQPPVNVPLSIYACSIDDITGWFSGRYDGRAWHADMSSGEEEGWYVLGWRQPHAPLDTACVDCDGLPTHPLGHEPPLLRATPVA
ncbi:hypothetical protein [Pseudoxanthomonas beigongshangi]